MTNSTLLTLSLSKGREREAAARLLGPVDGAQGEEKSLIAALSS
jgi:hypothetical protein